MGNYDMYNYDRQCDSCDQGQRRSCLCSMRVICLLVLLFAFAVGLILGAIFAPFILAALAAIIVFAIIMAIAIVALLLYRRCDNC